MKTYLRTLIAVSAAVLIGLSLAPSRAGTLDLLAGFEGPTSGWIPADPIIAAGPSSLVTMVSGKIAIFNKQGVKLFEQNLGAGGFWAAQLADQVAEPWVIFDPNSERFIASAAEFGSGKGRLYLAVSQNSNPLSSADWNKYSMDRSGTHQAAGFAGVPTYPDYAKVGVDGDAIYVTAGHFAKDQGITGLFSHAEIFALAKSPLLSGGPLQVVHDEPVIAEWVHPTIVFEPEPAMYFVQATARQPDDKITVHALSDILTAPSHVAFPVAVSPFDRPPNVPQRGSSTILLENIDARLMSAVARDGSLWTAHAVKDSAGESVVRWYQFDITGLPTAAATLVQSGNVDPGLGVHTWLPAINVDADGNMGLSFSVGGANQYAAIGYTGRLANDPAGTTLPVQFARAGAGPYTQGGWGEYSGLAIDPDGYTFWLFHQYPTKQKNWRTFVGAFEVAPPPPPSDPLHVGDLDGGRAIQSGSKWRATVVVTMHNGSEGPVQGASVSVQWSTGATGTATTDANGRCTFTLGNLSRQGTPSVTLTIANATHASLSYSPAANHDVDGDSNGTSITVNRP